MVEYDPDFKTDRLASVILDVRDGTRAALEMAGAGDLVVLQCDDVEQVLSDVDAYKEARASVD